MFHISVLMVSKVGLLNQTGILYYKHVVFILLLDIIYPVYIINRISFGSQYYTMCS